MVAKWASNLHSILFSLFLDKNILNRIYQNRTNKCLVFYAVLKGRCQKLLLVVRCDFYKKGLQEIRKRQKFILICLEVILRTLLSYYSTVWKKCQANPISHLCLFLLKNVQNFTVWSSSDVQGHFVVEVSHLLTQMTPRHILLFGQYKSSLSAHVYPTSYYCTHFSWLLL